HELLAAVSPLEEQELERALVELLDAELIYRRGLPPQVTYEFKHALVQDAAYQSLLKSTRQQYHQRVAQTLEQGFPQIVEAEPELVAHHYSAAQLPTEAISYWQKAGERAKERSANEEAATHFSKGLELLATQPDTPERAARELDINIALGPALTALKGPATSEVGQVYGRARELSKHVGNASQRFTATWGMWIHHHFNAQLRTALGLAEEILALAEQEDDPTLRLEARHAAWTTRFYVPEWASCRANAEQGIALYDMNQHHALGLVYGGHDPGVCAHNNLGISLWYLGYPDQALAQSQQAMQLAELLSHPMSLALAFSYSCWTRHCRGEANDTRQGTKDTIRQCTEHSVAPHHVALVTVLGGWALAAQGHVQEGIAEMEQGLGGRGRTRGSPLRRPQNLVLLASAYETIGKTQEGRGAIAEALEIIAKTQERWCESEIYRIEGQILLSGSAKNQSAAEDSFKQAIEVARHHQTKSLELRAATSLARLWGDQGKRTQAQELLTPVYGWFTEGFDTADLKEAKALLDELA
ncbi:MAG: adenylate/guanylate cyclase domain-containing protein, partial [Acidiferrobacterales bacterium]